MKIWKLVAGILSVAMCAIILLQSCAAGVVNTLAPTGDVSGSVGVLVALLMLTGGIVSAVTRRSEAKGGDIALIVLFGLAALLGFTCCGIFTDLIVWASWCTINAGIALIDLIRIRKRRKNAFRSENNFD